MKISIGEARRGLTVISFGPVLQSDPDAKFMLFVCEYDINNPNDQPKMTVMRQGKIPRKGRIRIQGLAPGKYMVMAQGEDVAGLVHTANKVLEAPFYLSLDAEPSQKAAQEAKRKEEANRRRHRPNVLRQAIRYILRQG